MKKTILFLILLSSCGKFFGYSKRYTPSVIMADKVTVQVDDLDAINDVITRDNLKVRTLNATDKIYVLQGDMLGKEEVLAKELSQMDGVIFAEPVYNVKLLGVDEVKEVAPPKDRLWMYQWSLKNYGQDSISGTEGVEGADVSILKAWTITEGSPDVVVAVVDTGVDYNHINLKGNMWVNEAEKKGTPGVDDDGNGYVDDIYGWNTDSSDLKKTHYGKLGSVDPMDGDMHGTHVSGTIAAARGGDNRGIAGVAPKVKIMPVRILQDGGLLSGTDTLYEGLHYVAQNAKYVDVVNASFGLTTESALLKRGMQELRDAKILVAVAAGNSSVNNDLENNLVYPANYDFENIITVAATNNRDGLTGFSNFGMEKVHIAAPGDDIVSTIPGNAWAAMSGTSMAAPHVAGAAALVISSDPKYKKNPALVKQVLMDNVDVLDDLTSKVASGGRLNVYKALVNANAGKGRTSAVWNEESYFLKTPEHPSEKFDKIWEIKKDGASEIQIHVDMGYIDGYDSCRVFDEKYNLIADIEGEIVDRWLPPVKGEKLYLLFSNAVMQINDDAPYNNLFSKGVTIDKIRYVAGGENNESL